MFSFVDYLAREGVALRSDGSIEPTAQQVLDYLKALDYGSDVWLSSVSLSEPLVIKGPYTFGNFDATMCDFKGGIEIIDCDFIGDGGLNFAETYVHKKFIIKKVDIASPGVLSMPPNILDELQDGAIIEVIDFKGNMSFNHP